MTASPEDAVAMTEMGGVPYITLARIEKVIVWRVPTWIRSGGAVVDAVFKSPVKISVKECDPAVGVTVNRYGGVE